MAKNYFVSTNIGGPYSRVRNIDEEWSAVVNSVSQLVRNAMNENVSTTIEVTKSQEDNTEGKIVARIEVNFLANQIETT